MTTQQATLPDLAAAPARPDPDAGADLVIVNEQWGEVGGTERVLAALMERYPLARVLAPSFRVGNVGPGGEAAPTGRVDEIGRGFRKRHHLAPRYARWVARAPVGPARVVISLAHHGWAAAVTVPPGARHVCYSAGLSRAFYGASRDYLVDYPPPLRPLLRATLPALRAHHRSMLRRPDRVLTNSHVSAAALEPLLGAAPEVVYPPVRTGYFAQSAEQTRRHFLVVARITPQKRVDAVVDAFAGLDERLVVAGDGPWLERLRSRAPANVTFTGYLPDAELRRLYGQSHALICPSVEEFGIVMAEAHASGTPVIAPRAGGALEIVREPDGGVLVDRTGVAELCTAVRAVRSRSFDHVALRESAERFSTAHFIARLETIVDEERRRALS